MTPGWTAAVAAGAHDWAEADEAPTSEAATMSPAMRLFFMGACNEGHHGNLRQGRCIAPRTASAPCGIASNRGDRLRRCLRVRTLTGLARLDRPDELPARARH